MKSLRENVTKPLSKNWISSAMNLRFNRLCVDCWETSLNWESLYLEFFNIDSQMHFLEALWVSSRSVGNVFRLDAIASLGLRACFKRPIIKIAVLDHFQEQIWWIWLALSHQGWVQDRLAHFAGVLFAKGGQGGGLGLGGKGDFLDWAASGCIYKSSFPTIPSSWCKYLPSNCLSRLGFSTLLYYISRSSA